jgi:hypothetical protein
MHYLHCGFSNSSLTCSVPVPHRALSPELERVLDRPTHDSTTRSTKEYAIHHQHGHKTFVTVPQSHIPSSPSGTVIGNRRQPRGQFSIVLWTVLALGIMVFTCGATLVAMSLTGGAVDLWKIGTPLVLAGQALMFVGLALQLDLLGNYFYRHSVSGIAPTPREKNRLRSRRTVDLPRF